MTRNFLVAFLLGYVLGSFPSAYLFVRWKSRKDIREIGSGNVGALNSYLVTRSRLVGAAVFFLDLIKGFAAAAAPLLLFKGGPAEGAVAGLAAILGHNFSVWLKFRGGRGLATAAGVALVLAWPVIPAWILFWGAGFLFTRNVNVGNAIATLLLIVAAMVLPASILEHLVHGMMASDEARLFIVLIFGVILIKHIAPVREFVLKKREAKRIEQTIVQQEKEDS
jgi:acyl phosphate:glycerol-3-phosphate acyltransferase